MLAAGSSPIIVATFLSRFCTRLRAGTDLLAKDRTNNVESLGSEIQSFRAQLKRPSSSDPSSNAMEPDHRKETDMNISRPLRRAPGFLPSIASPGGVADGVPFIGKHTG
jgi:hypothetical protein